MTLKFNGQHVFRTGQRLTLETKPQTKKEDSEVRNAEKIIINELARGIISRAKEEERQLAASQPDPPPLLLLEKTQSQREVERHYQKPGMITTNANGVEAYAPPPCILAPLGEEEK